MCILQLLNEAYYAIRQHPTEIQINIITMIEKIRYKHAHTHTCCHILYYKRQ